MLKRFCTVITALTLVFVVSLGLFSGCKVKDNGLLADYKNRPKEVRVLHNNSGFGDQWIKDVAKYYMDNVDSETYINIKNTPLDGEEGIKLSAGTQTHDVYLLSYLYDYNKADKFLVDLRDIYDGKSTGENVLVKDKINDEIENKIYPKSSDKIYYLPYGEGISGYKFCYNLTTVEEALGSNYVLPRTTDELFEFGDALKAKNVFLTVAHSGDGMDYFSPEIWLAQAMGIENYNHALAGEYKNSQDQWVLSEDYPHVIEDNIDAYSAMYSVVSKLTLKANGYIHTDSDAMDFMDAERVLAGLGYGTNSAKVAYHYNGSYILGEMDEYLDAMAGSGKPQTMGATKVPLMSSVINRTPTIANDSVLRQVVDYVDGVTTTKPTGVSDADVQIVREARNISGAHIGGSIAIGKKAQNLDECKDFVRFLTTDIAQEIASNALGGLVRLPYGYNNYNEIKDDATVPQFIKDCMKIDIQTDYIVAQGGGTVNDLFVKYGGFSIHPIQINVFSNAGSKVEPSVYAQNVLNYYKGTRWTTIINNYKRALGE